MSGIALGLALLAALGDFVGGLLSIRGQSSSARPLLTGLAAGIMLGTCFLALLPEVVEDRAASGPILIVVGFLAVFLAENLFGLQAHGHGQHDGHDHEPAIHELVGQLPAEEPLITRAASWIALGGLAIHAFFDGVAIASTWNAGAATGMVTFLAVMLHKLPEGFSISAIMLAADFSRRGAVLGASGLAVMTVLGALFTVIAEAVDPRLGGVLLALAAGSLLYVVSTDLLPVVNRGGDRRTPIVVIAGVILVYGVVTLAHGVGLE